MSWGLGWGLPWVLGFRVLALKGLEFESSQPFRNLRSLRENGFLEGGSKGGVV